MSIKKPWDAGFKPGKSDGLNIFDDLSDRSESTIETLRKKRFELDTCLKKNWSWFVGVFISLWSICVMVILFFCGFSVMHLSDYVIFTLLSTTLANVLGLSYLVVKHLFSKESQ